MEFKAMDDILEKLDNILKNILELQTPAPVLFDILMFYYSKALELFEAKTKGKTFDVSEQINFISEQLGFDLNDIVLAAMNSETPKNELKPNEESANDDITNFILNSSKSAEKLDELDIDKYKQYIKDNLKIVNNKLNGIS